MNLRSARMRLRDVLVLHIEGDSEVQSAIETLARELTGLVQLPIIILTQDMTLESLSEAQMAKAGWVRSNQRVEIPVA